MSQMHSFTPNKLLRQAREHQGFTQEHLAELLGTTAFSIHRWEKGTVTPSLYYRMKLVEILGQSLANLGFESDTTETVPEQASSYLPPFTMSPTRFVGREHMLEQLVQLICQAPPESLFALSGLPGVGKTTLALALAHDPAIAADFPDGIIWLGIGPAPDLITILARLGGRLGVPPQILASLHDVDDFTQTIHGHIGTRRILFVLDDAWSIEAVTACQIGGVRCVHVLTTRSPSLAAQLVGPHVISVPELNEQEAFQLLEQYAPTATQQYPERIRHLIHQVGGLPLALTLTGATLAQASHNHQPRRIHRALDRMEQATRAMTPADTINLIYAKQEQAEVISTSLGQSIATSVEQLSPVAQVVLGSCSAFPPKPDSFDETAALAVSAISSATLIDALDELADAGLLETATSDRYTLHQTIAAYGQRFIDNQPARMRMVAYYADYAMHHRHHFNEIYQEMAGIFAALDQTEEKAASFIWGVFAVVPALLARGLHEVAQRYLLRVLDSARAKQDDANQCRSLIQLGIISQERNNIDSALHYAQQALTLAQSAADANLLSGCFRLLGVIADIQGHKDVMEEYYHQAITYAQQSTEQEYLGPVLLSWGSALEYQGRLSEAGPVLEEGVTFVQSQDMPELVCAFWAMLGITAAQAKRHDEAESFFTKGRILAEQIGHEDLLDVFYSHLANQAIQRGNRDSAEAYLHTHLALAHKIGRRDRECNALINLGVVAIGRKQLATAEPFLRQALVLARELGVVNLLAEALLNNADILVQRQQWDEAIAMLNEAEQLANAKGNRTLILAIASGKGEILEAQQRWEEAEQQYRHLRGQAQLMDLHGFDAIATFGLARVAAHHGHLAQARTYAEESRLLFMQQGGNQQLTRLESWLNELANTDV